MNSKKVALVAACDRNNYGDILLPLLVERYYNLYGNRNAEFSYFGLVKADLTGIGGKNTKPLRHISKDYEYVIVSGGEVLTSQYSNMWLNLKKNKILIKFWNIMIGHCPSLTNVICKLLLKGKSSMPWMIYPLSEHQKVYYNSVGGIGLNSIAKKFTKDWNNVIEMSESFTVRDKVTHDYFVKNGMDSRVCLLPDTAIIMSSLYSFADLENNFISVNKSYLDSLGEFYVVQINKKFGQGILQNIVSSINSIYKMTRLKCVLLPIGLAAGHDDLSSLKRIYSMCDKESVILFDKINIFDVMYVIARAKAFIGSSLHGIITAASFYVPHTVITSRAIKTLSFVRTWKTTSKICVDNQEQMINFLTDLDSDNYINNDEINNMKTMVIHYFDNLVKQIDNK